MGRGRPRLELDRWGDIRTQQRGDKWIARAYYRGADGRRVEVSRSSTTERKAKVALTEALMERANAGRVDLVTADAPVSRVIERWLKEVAQSDRSVSTQRTYRDMANNTITPALGEMRLGELSTARIDKFIQTLHHTRGRSTAVSNRKVLRMILDLAVRVDAIPHNYARNVIIAREKRVRIVAPTMDDIAGMRAVMHAWENSPSPTYRRTPELVDMVDLLTATGMRPGELLALRWRDIDLEAGTVTISGTMIVDLETKNTRQAHPKSESSFRTLTLPKYALAMLMRRHVEAIHDPVFPARTGGYKSAGNLRRKWRESISGTDYEGITPKSIRKTVATLLQDSIGTQAAQYQLGHASPGVTERHYIAKAVVAPDRSALLESARINPD